MRAGFVKRMVRNPWVIISATGHAIVLAVISVVVMTDGAEVHEPSNTTVTIAAPPEHEEIPPPQVVDRLKVPTLRDADIELHDLEDWVDKPELVHAEENLTDMPSGDATGGSAIGVAGPGNRGFAPSTSRGRPPGKFDPRFDRTGKRPSGGTQTDEAVRLALAWLESHQDEDGRWDTAGFMKHDKEGTPCDGPGRVTNDIGVTGLALLAFLGAGHTMRLGAHKNTVRKAVSWLKEQQDEKGLFGSESSHEFIYSHAIATLAMCEAYGLSEFQPLQKHAQAAVGYVLRARNPYGVWRYFPADGNNDTSVTGWMVLALVSAREFGLTIDETALESSRVWFDLVTDPATGRAGYTKRGEPSSRRAELMDRFPASKTEALTAVALLCRVFLGQEPKTTPVMSLAADTLLKLPPVWDPTSGTIDMYYWYYASFALFQMGGRRWETWNRKMTDAVVKSQRQDGNARGSWDPVDPWGEDGGRVYATATMCLCLEVYYRYARVLGGR
jgi:hypothetical protein